jgi:hypothetical protein
MKLMIINGKINFYNNIRSKIHASFRYVVEKLFAFSQIYEFNKQQNRYAFNSCYGFE